MKSSRKRFGLKGSTLSELCVVIGVIAIVSVSVVSFTTLAGAITKTSAAKEVAAERIDFIEDLVEGWVDNAAQKNATELKAQDNRLIATIDGVDYPLYFSSDAVTACFSQDNTVNLATEEIKAIDFEEMRNEKDVIFFCKITYIIENSKEQKIEKTYTFCVNTRLDDIV